MVPITEIPAELQRNSPSSAFFTGEKSNVLWLKPSCLCYSTPYLVLKPLRTKITRNAWTSQTSTELQWSFLKSLIKYYMQQTGMLLELYAKSYALNLGSGKTKRQGGFQNTWSGRFVCKQVTLETHTYLQSEAGLFYRWPQCYMSCEQERSYCCRFYVPQIGLRT